MRFLRTLFAVLVALMFGCLPTLSLASPATASPPTEYVGVSPETAHVALEINLRSDLNPDSESDHAAMTGGDGSASLDSTNGKGERSYPLRE